MQSHLGRTHPMQSYCPFSTTRIHLTVAICAAATAFLPHSARAIDFFWQDINGNANGVFSDPQHWFPQMGPPGPEDVANITLNPGAPYTVQLDPRLIQLSGFAHETPTGIVDATETTIMVSANAALVRLLEGTLLGRPTFDMIDGTALVVREGYEGDAVFLFRAVEQSFNSIVSFGGDRLAPGREVIVQSNADSTASIALVVPEFTNDSVFTLNSNSFSGIQVLNGNMPGTFTNNAILQTNALAGPAGISGQLNNTPSGVVSVVGDLRFGDPQGVGGENHVNNGVIDVAPDARLDIFGQSFDYGNGTINAEGTLAVITETIDTSNANLVINGVFFADTLINTGILSGGGTINANVINRGTIAPGNSTDDLFIDGDFSTEMLVEIEVAGVMIGEEYDTIDVTGTADLDGELDVILIDGDDGPFEPAKGDEFTILTATGGVTGKFAELSFPALPPPQGWLLTYGSNDVVLSVIPRIPGDFDADGDVDRDDYPILVDGMGILSGASQTDGDANGDGDVDGQDVLDTLLNFAFGVEPPVVEASAVPEPASICTSLVCLLAISLCRCRRK